MPDVIVVGAGPTGLLLAGDLAQAGIAVTVLERRAQESNLTRAFAVHARTLEALDARGLADELVATGQPVPELRLLGRVRIDLSRLPSRFPYLLVTPQYQTERLLTRRVRSAGRERPGAEVVGLRAGRGRSGRRRADRRRRDDPAGRLCGGYRRGAQRGARRPGPAVPGPVRGPVGDAGRRPARPGADRGR